MSRTTDPQPYFSSVELFLEERRVAEGRSGGGIAVESSDWWPGYVEGVIDEFRRQDKVREFNELAYRNRPWPGRPSCSMKIEED